MYAARNLSVRIGSRTILDQVDLVVPPGRVVVVIGPNGAGKSTLLRTMAGERRPSDGSILLNGTAVADLSPSALAGRRAVLPQAIAVTAPFTVDEILRLGIPPSVRRADADALVLQALSAVEMIEARPRPITHLSGGEQQRIHAARVLVQLWAQPNDGFARYLLLDEPTAHLDPAHQLAILRLARSHASAGGGVLAILHDLNLAMNFADEVVVMHRGRVLAAGAPEDAISAPLLSDVYGVAFQMLPAEGRCWILPAVGEMART